MSGGPPRLLRLAVLAPGAARRVVRGYPPGALNRAFAHDPAAARTLLTKLGRRALAVQCRACAAHAAWAPVATTWWTEFEHLH